MTPISCPPSVIIVAYGTPELLDRSLDALRCAEEETPLPTIVVDNSSDRAVADVTARYGAAYIDPGVNLGFARAVNLGISNLSRPSDVLLLNPDATIDRATVEELQRRLRSEGGTACAAPAQVDPDGRAQRVEWPIPSPLRAWLDVGRLGHWMPGPRFLIGSILLIRHEALRDVGSFDERFFLYAEETDWQQRAIQGGWKTRYCRDLEAVHVGAATSSDSHKREILFAIGQELYIRKWHGTFGWELYRLAQGIGALIRALLGSESGRRNAMQRCLIYAIGPLRLGQYKNLYPAS